VRGVPRLFRALRVKDALTWEVPSELMDPIQYTGVATEQNSDPSFSRDGNYVYFASKRGSDIDFAIYKSSRGPKGFGPAVRESVSINGVAPRLERPQFRQYGTTEELCFQATVGNIRKIHCVRRAQGATDWSAAAREQGLGGDAFCPVMAADGQTMYFSSLRNAERDQEIFAAHRDSNDSSTWMLPVVFPEGVNSPAIDQPVWISPDECTMYLTSSRVDDPNAPFRIFVATRSPQ
jgi:WD40-like Beta Propeller Repeat